MNASTLRMRLAFLLLSFLLLAGLSAAAGIAFLRASASDDMLDRIDERYGYDFVGWELRSAPNKLLYEIGHVFSSPDTGEKQDSVLRYFELARTIRALQQQTGTAGAEALSEAQRERAALENRVENVLEGEIAAILRKQGITFSPPLFGGIDMVFPPVDFELDSPPKILAVSPRERIELSRSFRLQSGLLPQAVTAIEAEAEATGLSAAVLDISGVSTYPSVIPELASYRSVVNTAIHEWTHQYLALYPLGRSYFRNDETRTLNETVADIVGDELSTLFLQRYPLAEAQSPATAQQAFDFAGEMRALRLNVEALLQAGRIQEAERLMEEKRLFFAERGVFIRKINQAYFAFNGFYATGPGSINPIGPKLQTLRERSHNLADFLRTAAQITGERQLDALLGPE